MKHNVLTIFLCFAMLLTLAGCIASPQESATVMTPAPTTVPPTTLPEESQPSERVGFVNGNLSGFRGMMAGDGEWVYYRSETDLGLYKARTDGSEITQLLSPEQYSPCSINVLDDWVYFSNFRDGFCVHRVRTDGTQVEKLADAHCPVLYVAESGIYFEDQGTDGISFTYRMNLDGSGLMCIAEGVEPVSYYDGRVYLYDLSSGALSAYDVYSGQREAFPAEFPRGAYFSVDASGIYYWATLTGYCHWNPETGQTTLLHPGPIGDHYNYLDGTLCYAAYGGENNDYVCCYAMDVATQTRQPILSLSPELFGYDGEPIGITVADYRVGNFDPDALTVDSQGEYLIIDEYIWGIYYVNGKIFANGYLQERMPESCWILCDGKDGTPWG